MTRLRRPLRILAIPLLALVIAIAGACYVTAAVYDGAFAIDHEPHDFNVRVVAIDANTITLTGDSDDLDRDGRFGIEWVDGYAQAGAILDREGDEVTREFLPLSPQFAAPPSGAEARLDSFAYPSDPTLGRGLFFEDVTYPAPAGDTPAWFVPGDGETWAIFVHGRSADRREGLRILRTLHQLTLPVLLINYLNDVELPTAPDARYGFGETEWEDLEAAVGYAIGEGAGSVVLVGFSMGGAIVMSFLYQSPLASHVSGVILDAPMLNFAATVDMGLGDGGVPGFLHGTARWLVDRRYGVDWKALDYIAPAGRLAVPLLLFHGDADPTVPVETSRALKAARPALVTYIERPGVAHVRSWNAAPEQYEASVTRFVQSLFGIVQKAEREAAQLELAAAGG